MLVRIFHRLHRFDEVGAAGDVQVAVGVDGEVVERHANIDCGQVVEHLVGAQRVDAYRAVDGARDVDQAVFTFGQAVGELELAGCGVAFTGWRAVCDVATTEDRVELFTLGSVSIKRRKVVAACHTRPTLAEWSLLVTNDPSPRAATLFGEKTSGDETVRR